MQPRRFTLVEILVMIAVLGMLSAFLFPAIGSQPPRTDDELELGNWRPGPEHLAAPPDSIRVLEANLGGKWTDGSGWTELSVTELRDGRYGVSFDSHARCGLSGSVKLQRVATYGEGKLDLDRPVQELTGATYQRLYSVRINDTVCLVPSVRVAEIRAAASEIPWRGVLTQHSP